MGDIRGILGVWITADMVISQNNGPQYKTQNLFILVMGSPPKVPVIWGTPLLLTLKILHTSAFWVLVYQGHSGLSRISSWIGRTPQMLRFWCRDYLGFKLQAVRFRVQGLGFGV